MGGHQRVRWVERVTWIKPCIVLGCLITILLVLPSVARAGIYRYVDQDGVIHFSNVPTNPQYTLYIKEDGDIDFRYSDKNHFDHLIEGAARTHGVDPALVKAIIRAESDFDPRAVSRTGAMGLMQLMPETANDLAVIDAFDPGENIDAGVRHFKDLLELFQNDVKLSLAAYNAGKRAVLQFNAIPPYGETQRYVKKVLHFYQVYKR
ncbi:MAG: transglycosylase SLT domain-containing protein [Proteobacteria bacterium]|nr:transglycosylase SLT domain-containing protein [Pseudomonadota bacterium]NIS68366.1 transglycosylase SLT domain-containing protein [Pseudomonadota bacterium]